MRGVNHSLAGVLHQIIMRWHKHYRALVISENLAYIIANTPPCCVFYFALHFFHSQVDRLHFPIVTLIGFPQLRLVNLINDYIVLCDAVSILGL